MWKSGNGHEEDLKSAGIILRLARPLDRDSSAGSIGCMAIRNLRVVTWFLLVSIAPLGGRAETAHFLFGGRAVPGGDAIFAHVTPESFVVPVSDPAQIATLREYLARRKQGLEPHPMIASLRLALGGDGINRNYAAPRAPAWGWRVETVLGLQRLMIEVIDASVQPARDFGPSAMERFLRGEFAITAPTLPGQPAPPPPPPPTDVNLFYYHLQMELRTDARAKFVNVANRGHVGAGERALIAGFVIDGGVPRNVIVRVLGPSLAAYGVTEPLADPRLEIFRGGIRLAENDSWTTTSLNLAYPSAPASALPASPLAPPDSREPAVQLSLEPGAYTAIARGAGATTGIALIEVYDLDPAD